MASTASEQKLIASNQKVIQQKATIGFIFQICVKSQVLGLHVSISDLMTYPLTLTPYSMATIDGFFAKTNKAQGMNYLIKDAVNAYALLRDPDECALMQEGNSSFYMKDVPPTMKTPSQRIFGSLPAAADTIFSIDPYVDHLHSPKSAERDRRGCGERFVVDGLNIHRPVDWKGFLTNDENKKSYSSLELELCFYDGRDCSKANHLHRRVLG